MNTKSQQYLQELKEEAKNLTFKNNKQIPIDKKGSLGLLALGAKGVMAWKLWKL